MMPNEGSLLFKSFYNGTECVRAGNGTTLPIKHIGSFAISIVARSLSLKNVFHVPSLKSNLILVRQLCWDNNCSVIFYESFVCVKHKTLGRTLLEASSSGTLYPVHVTSSSSIGSLS